MFCLSFACWSERLWVELSGCCPQNCPISTDLWLGRGEWQLKVWLSPVLSSFVNKPYRLLPLLAERSSKRRRRFAVAEESESWSREKSVAGNWWLFVNSSKTKSTLWQLKARKEGVEGSKSEEEGVTLKSEPVDIGAHFKVTRVHMRQTQALRSTQASLRENLKWAENLQDPDYRWKAEMNNS